MKFIHKTILIASFLFWCSTTFAQDSIRVVEVTVNKATSITFPANILDGIKVSRDVLSQRPKGIDNVLLLTAKRPQFRETNLTVFTGDRKLYQFVLRYADQPADFMIEVGKAISTQAMLQLSSEMTKAELEECSRKVIASPAGFPKRSSSKFGMRLTLEGIYIERNVMFFHLRINNATNIAYHPQMLRLFIKDKKQSKRTASQEIQQKPINKYGTADVINGNESVDVVFAVPKFTIPDAKVLNIELMERNGGRHLRLKIKNGLIVKARKISE